MPCELHHRSCFFGNSGCQLKWKHLIPEQPWMHIHLVRWSEHWIWRRRTWGFSRTCVATPSSNQFQLCNGLHGSLHMCCMERGWQIRYQIPPKERQPGSEMVDVEEATDGGFHKWKGPIYGWFILENPSINGWFMMIWGCPHFWKPPDVSVAVQFFRGDWSQHRINQACLPSPLRVFCKALQLVESCHCRCNA